jgi:hypothetical protein
MFWFNVKWHLKINWRFYFVSFLMISTAMLFCGIRKGYFLKETLKRMRETRLASEQIVLLADGKLLTLRNTGSYNVYDMELKFENGSILLMTYSFCRSNNIREGRHYKIGYSSLYGYQCRLISSEENQCE